MIWLILEIWGALFAAFIVGALVGVYIGRRSSPALAKAAAFPELSAPDTSAMAPPSFSTTPPVDGGDDLAEIIGVGEVDKKRLNSLGVFRLQDIAAWTDENVRWIESQIGEPGRVLRERWVEQARNLHDPGHS